MAQPLEIGILGAGPWARMVTGPMLAAGPQTRVTGVWSRSTANARRLAQELDARAFGRVEELLDACAAVAIAVAPAAQPELAVRAAQAGKTLFLEKPLGADLVGAQSIADAVDEAGVGTLVMLSNRFNPALEPFLADAAALEPFGGCGCFVSGAFLGGPFATGWRLERGAVLDIGPHLLDLLDAALGPIVDVRAAGDPHGWVSVLCMHASGATSNASMCCSTAGGSRTEIEVFGPRGRVSFDGRTTDARAVFDKVRDALVLVTNGGSHPADVPRALHLQRLIDQIESQLTP